MNDYRVEQALNPASDARAALLALAMSGYPAEVAPARRQVYADESN